MSGMQNPYAKPKRKAPDGVAAADAAERGDSINDDADARKRTKQNKQVSPLVKVIRHFTSTVCPGFDKATGRIYTTDPGKVGNASRSSRIYYATSHQFLKKFLPNAPFWYPPSPHVRAHNLRSTQGAWTRELQVQAMHEFMVPNGLKIYLLCPELTHYEILQKYDEFRCPEGGVKPPCFSEECPNNGTNAGVSLKEWTAAKGDHGIKMICTLSGERMPLVSATWLCTHKGIDGKTTSHSFSTVTNAAWRQYPESVRRQHLQYVSLESNTPLDFSEVEDEDYGEEDKEKEIGLVASWDLCYYLATAVDPPSEIHQRMKSHENRLRLSMRHDYQNFVNNEDVRWNGRRAGQLSIAKFVGRASNNEMTWNDWPVLDLALVDKYFDSPSKTWILALEKQQYKLVAPYLRRDILSRPVGKILRWDGTYKIMTKTINDPDMEAPALVLLIVLGTYGNILYWAFADSEDDKCWQRIMIILAERSLRIDPTGATVKETLAIYSDTCHGSLKDPKEHWITKIFPSVSRAPYRDNFHSQKMVTGSMNKANPLYPAICGELARALLKNDPITERLAVRAYMKNEKSTLSRELAKKQMLQKKPYRASIMRYPPTIEARISSIRRIGEKYLRKDEEHAEAAKREENKYARLFSKQVDGKQRGTKYEIENLCRHIELGCNDYPLPMEQMYVNAKPMVPSKGCRLMPLMSLQGTSSVESTNWQVALVAITTTRMTADTTHMRLDKRFGIFNAEKDKAIAHLTRKEGTDPKDIDWFLQDALLKDGSHVFASPQYKRQSVPPEVDLKMHDEPIGKAFLATIDDEKYNLELDMVLNDTVDFCTRRLESTIQATETIPAAALPIAPMTPRAQAQSANSPSAASPFQSTELSPSPVTASSLTQSPSPLAGRLPDMGYGSGWNRVIGGHTKKTVANLMIPGDLTKEQEKIFMELLSNYMNVYAKGRALNMSDLVDKIQVAWRDRHFKTIPANDFGLGGLLSPENIKRLLRKYGMKVSAGAMNMEATFPALESALCYGVTATATIPLPELSRSTIAPGYPNPTQIPAAASLPMTGYVGHPYALPNALLPCPRVYSSVFSNDSLASVHRLSRTVSVTHANLNSYQNNVLQKALRKICAPTRGYSRMAKAREYLEMYFRAVRNPNHKIVVDLDD